MGIMQVFTTAEATTKALKVDYKLQYASAGFAGAALATASGEDFAADFKDALDAEVADTTALDGYTVTALTPAPASEMTFKTNANVVVSTDQVKAAHKATVEAGFLPGPYEEYTVATKST